MQSFRHQVSTQHPLTNSSFKAKEKQSMGKYLHCQQASITLPFRWVDHKSMFAHCAVLLFFILGPLLWINKRGWRDLACRCIGKVKTGCFNSVLGSERKRGQENSQLKVCTVNASVSLLSYPGIKSPACIMNVWTQRRTGKCLKKLNCVLEK